MELDDILANGEVIVDSNNSAVYERMNQLADKQVSGLSNCFGTVAHLLGVEEDILMYWQRVLRTPEVRNRRCSYDYIQYNDEGKPGYVGPLPMTLFLTKSMEAREISKNQAVNNVVSFFQETADEEGRRVLIHSGIYLGQFHGMEFMFHQNGCGGEFELVPVKNCLRKYYSESVFNLYSKGRNGIPVKFFEVKAA